MRIAAVANWRITYNGPSPNTSRPIWENTVWSWLGYGAVRWASTETPKNSTPRIPAIHMSVIEAFLDSGRRNAGTPFEMASTPVSATAPDEKPFRMMKSVSVPPNSFVPSNCSLSNGTWQRCPKKLA